MISAHRDTDRAVGPRVMSTLIDALNSAAPVELPELITLGRTLRRGAADVLASFTRPDTSNGPTQAISRAFSAEATSACRTRRRHHQVPRRDRRLHTTTTTRIARSQLPATRSSTRSAASCRQLTGIIVLGRTRKCRAADVLTHSTRPGTGNGPTDTTTGRLEHLLAGVLGVRILTNRIPIASPSGCSGPSASDRAHTCSVTSLTTCSTSTSTQLTTLSTRERAAGRTSPIATGQHRPRRALRPASTHEASETICAVACPVQVRVAIGSGPHGRSG